MLKEILYTPIKQVYNKQIIGVISCLSPNN